MFETLSEIDQVRLNFSSDGSLLLNITIAFIMFGVALEIKTGDFLKVFAQPKSAITGIVSQFLLMPLITFCFVLSIKDFITPTTGLGMILVAACPGGNISNFVSSLARGNVALSVSLTAFSSVAGIVLTPLNFAIWGDLFLRMYQNGSPGLVPDLTIDILSVLQTIVMILGLPLILGILVNEKLPKLTAKIVVSFKRISILLFLTLLAVIFGNNFDLFVKYIPYVFVLVLIHNGLALMTGYFAGRAMGLNKRDCKTISIETGIQNSGLALALLFNPLIFPVDTPIGGMAFIAAWWGVWHIISGLSLAGFWSGFSLKPKQDTLI